MVMLTVAAIVTINKAVIMATPCWPLPAIEYDAPGLDSVERDLFERGKNISAILIHGVEAANIPPVLQLQDDFYSSYTLCAFGPCI